jgi:hypothetical protein
LAYGVFIAGGYAAIVTLSRKDYKTLGLALALLGLVLLPGASLRYVPLPGTSTKYAFDLEDALSTYNAEDLISYVNGTPFYGFNLDKLRTPIGEGTSSPWSVVLSWSYLWILGLSFLWSLYELRRRGPVAPLIVASALLVLLCAVPYTGWLVGYVVTARMLWRSFLLFPIGLAAVSLVWPIFNAVSSRLSAGPRREIFAQRATMFTILPICILLIIYSSIQQLQLGWQNLSGMKEYQGNLEYMAALGDDLESNIQEPATFLASVGLMRYLPGLSSKAKVVYFRAPQFTPYSVHREELARVRSSDHQISIEERMEVLRRYNIRYLLTQNAGLARLLAEFPQFFRKQRLGGYWLIEFEELTP